MLAQVHMQREMAKGVIVKFSPIEMGFTVVDCVGRFRLPYLDSPVLRTGDYD